MVSGSTATAIALSWAGLFQIPDLSVWDKWLQLRSREAVDRRVVVVTIDEADIAKVGTWPIPDAILAKLLQTLNTQHPRVVGLDIYRDLPVNPGNPILTKVFQSMPNLIGAEKRFGSQQVSPPPALAQLGQVAVVDLVVDPDGRVRRDLLSAKDTKQPVILSMGSRLAVDFLQQEGLSPQEILGSTEHYHLGKAVIKPFRGNDGGYVRMDDQGYQVLLNYRGSQENFQTISLSEVLDGKIPQDFVRDRIVLIGSTAESTNDFFLTPYDGSSVTRFTRTAGVFIHATLASQLVSAALDGRAMIQTLPDWVEACWVLFWSLLEVLLLDKALSTPWLGKRLSYLLFVLGSVLATGGLAGVTYLIFLGGWWLPIVSSLVGMVMTAIARVLWHGYELQQLAFFDGLTQVANRRYFDQRLAELIDSRRNLALILCDVDCFKSYNDTYGHQAGDVCLQQIAASIHDSVRKTDVVARYGGEEFAVILPYADQQTAIQVAERIVSQVRALNIPHSDSIVAEYVTLSCGVAYAAIRDEPSLQATLSAARLLSMADDALYLSKKSGRDRFTLVI